MTVAGIKGHRYMTNNSEYKFIELYQPAKEGDVICLSKRDISGFSFPVFFKITFVEIGFVNIEPYVPNYGNAFDGGFPDE